MPTDTQQAQASSITPETYTWDHDKEKYVPRSDESNMLEVESRDGGVMMLRFPCGALVNLGDLRRRRKTVEWFTLMNDLPDEMACLLPATAFCEGSEGHYVACRNGHLELWDDAYNIASGVGHPWMRFDLKEVSDLFGSTARSR